jgi:hypothetical protein
VLQAAVGVGAFFLPDDADAFATEPAKAADDGLIFAVLAIASERHKVGDQPADVVNVMRALRMPRDLSLLPRSQFAIEFLERQRCFDFDTADLFVDGDGIAARLHRAQFLDLGLELSHGFFEIEIAAHHISNILFLAQRVQIAHQAFQALFEHVGINLRRRNIGVAEQCLYYAKIGTVVQQMAGKSVAQHVRADL